MHDPFVGLVVLQEDLTDVSLLDLVPAMWVEADGDFVKIRIPGGLVLAISEARREIERQDDALTRMRDYLSQRASR